MADGGRHSTRFHIDSSQAGPSSQHHSSQPRMTPLEKVLAAEPKSGSWKVVHDGKRSEYRINGICVKCTSRTVLEMPKDPRQFRQNYVCDMRVVNYKKIKEKKHHFAISLLDINADVSETDLTKMLNDMLSTTKYLDELDTYRTPPPYDMAIVEVPTFEAMEESFKLIMLRYQEFTLNPASVVKDPFCLKFAKKLFKQGMVMQPTKVLAKHVDCLYEIHRSMDQNLTLPTEYYDKMKNELKQKRLDEEEKRAEEAKRIAYEAAQQCEAIASSSKAVEEKPKEEVWRNGQKVFECGRTQEEINRDGFPKRQSRWGNSSRDDQRFEREPPFKYNEDRRWNNRQNRQDYSPGSSNGSNGKKYFYRRSEDRYHHRQDRFRRDRSRSKSPRRYHRDYSNNRYDRRDADVKRIDADVIPESRKLDPAERLRRLHMGIEKTETPKIPPPKLFLEPAPPLPQTIGYPPWDPYDNSNFSFNFPPPPLFIDPPPPPEKKMDEKELAFNTLMHDVTMEIRAKIKQTVEVMFKNLISKEGKERARKHVEAERRIKAEKQAALRALKKPVVPTNNNMPKPFDIKICGPIPKKQQFKKVEPPPKPPSPKPLRERSPVASGSSRTSTSCSIRKNSTTPPSVHSTPPVSAFELLQKRMKEIDDAQATEKSEEATILKLEEHLQFLKSDKTVSGKGHRKRVKDKIQRLQTAFEITKKNVKSLIMGLPALRISAATEDSPEWRKFREKETSDKLKACKKEKALALAKAAAEKREAKEAEKRAKELEKAMKTMVKTIKKDKSPTVVPSDNSEDDDGSSGSSSEGDSSGSSSGTDSEDSESDAEVAPKKGAAKKVVSSEVSSETSESEYNPSDASSPKPKQQLLKRKKPIAVQQKEKAIVPAKKAKVQQPAKPKAPAKKPMLASKKETLAAADNDEFVMTSLNQFYFGIDVKPIKNRKIDLLSPSFWEEAEQFEEEDEIDEPVKSREFFVYGDVPLKPGSGARVRYDKRTRQEEYETTMSMANHPFDEEELLYLEMAFAKSSKKKELPFATSFQWNSPVYCPDPEQYLEPVLQNGVLEYYPDPDLKLLAPVLEGTIRLHGLFKYTRMEKMARRRVTVPPRLDITADDKQMVKNYQTQYKADNTLLRQLRTAGLEGLSLLKSNALATRPICVTFAPSRIHDWGLFTLEEIKPRSMIIEYIGEFCRSTVVDVREKRYLRRGIGSSYLFRVDQSWVIDATRMGNSARFINHSCTPNSYARVVRGTHIAIYSKRLIHAGEEITYDYKFPLEDTKIPCFCNSQSCRGTLN